VLACLQDRPVPGAAAEVAGDRVGELGRRPALAMSIERHDEARRAEAALRSMAIDHGLLHRVQPIASLESLDGDDLLPLERADAQDAGIHRLVTYFAGQSEVGKH